MGGYLTSEGVFDAARLDRILSRLAALEEGVLSQRCVRALGACALTCGRSDAAVDVAGAVHLTLPRLRRRRAGAKSVRQDATDPEKRRPLSSTRAMHLTWCAAFALILCGPCCLTCWLGTLTGAVGGLGARRGAGSVYDASGEARVLS